MKDGVRRGDAVKRDIHKFAENMIAVIETKKKEMLNKAEKKNQRIPWMFANSTMRGDTSIETAGNYS